MEKRKLVLFSLLFLCGFRVLDIKDLDRPCCMVDGTPTPNSPLVGFVVVIDPKKEICRRSVLPGNDPTIGIVNADRIEFSVLASANTLKIDPGPRGIVLEFLHELIRSVLNIFRQFRIHRKKIGRNRDSDWLRHKKFS